MKGSAAPNNARELLAALIKPGKDADVEMEVGSRVEYIRSPRNVSHNSRMISMING